jgi:hypothetical protein
MNGHPSCPPHDHHATRCRDSDRRVRYPHVPGQYFSVNLNLPVNLNFPGLLKKSSSTGRFRRSGLPQHWQFHRYSGFVIGHPFEMAFDSLQCFVDIGKVRGATRSRMAKAIVISRSLGFQ